MRRLGHRSGAIHLLGEPYYLSTIRLVYGVTSVVELGKSPGGSDENTGNASAFSDKLMMGFVEVILTNPVKLDRPSSGPRLAAPCANGPRVMTWLPSGAP